MSDALVVASASQALVLASAASEQQLAVHDGRKRKGDWNGEAPPKRGKRWGSAEDRPFKPPPFVSLPVGLTEDEVDQFLREQRLEDLHRKILANQLEDVEPDIRPPSPPPVYDRSTGKRLNTREERIRKAMLAEYNRLVRYMVKHLEGYEPPLDWKPQKLVKKVIIPYEKYPQAPFMGVIIGARGVNHKRLQEVTGCKINIRGKDVGDRWQTDEELLMPSHVHIEADREEQIEAAEKLLMPLLDPSSAEFEYARTNGMQQLATVNGYTIKSRENRCGICFALGHLGFECPEVVQQSYKMANVKCELCGDKGHVTADCKLAAEKHQQENVDWKKEAEKKRELDAEYRRMMGDLGNQKYESTEASEEEKKQELDAEYRRMMGDLGLGPEAGETPEAATAGAVAARSLQIAAKASTRPPMQEKVAPRPVLSLPAPPVAAARAPQRPGLGYTPPPQRAIRPSFEAAVVASGAQAMPRPPRRATIAPPPRHAPGMAPALVRPPWAPSAASNAPPPPAPSIRPAVSLAAPSGLMRDSGIVCPEALEQRLRMGGELEELSQDSGAQVSLAPNRRFMIFGAPEVVERAKLHIRAWLDVNSLSGPPPHPFDGGFPPGGLCPPGMPPGFPSELPPGMPPGFPPELPPGFPPDVPSAGFPPGLPPGFPPGFAPPMAPVEAAPPDPLALGAPAPWEFTAPADLPPAQQLPPMSFGGPCDLSGFIGRPPVLNDDPEI